MTPFKEGLMRGCGTLFFKLSGLAAAGPTKPQRSTIALSLAAGLALSLVVGACGSSEQENTPIASEPRFTPSTAAESLLARSLQFHDPEGHWDKRTVQLTWVGTNPEGEERVSFDIAMPPGGSSFEMNGHYEGTLLEYATDGETVTAKVNGELDLDEELKKKMVLGREDGLFWRNYFGFLAAFPMNLCYPDTHLDPGVAKTSFMDRDVESVRVTFDPEVGGDVWYFYFAAESAELVGCRFYHDEAANDGEYIAFQGLVEADGLKLPQRRAWYMNADDRYLGTDTITQLTLADGYRAGGTSER